MHIKAWLGSTECVLHCQAVRAATSRHQMWCKALVPTLQATLRRITASKRADRATPGLLRHLCDVHLTLGADKLPAGSVQSMAAQASTVLLAICIR